MEKDKNYWHTNEEIPENGSCVLWKVKLFSKERGNIEGGRYDRCYNCFCGTASLFVNRSSIKQWIYCKDIFDILDQNTRLQKQLDREIHINRIMKRALEGYADKDNWEYYNLDSSDECLIGEYQNCEYNEVGFEPAQQVLKEIENKE